MHGGGNHAKRRDERRGARSAGALGNTGNHVSTASGPLSRAVLQIAQTNIATLQVDAIVNAANNTLLGGGGVDGAIHRAAGPALLAFCRTLGGCATGDAKITPGFQLPARHVIHAVGPVWRGGTAGERELLARCYQRSLDIAYAYDLRSIAFPAISTGVYGYPAASAADVAVRTVRDVLGTMPQHFTNVIFVCFDAATAAIYNARIR